MNEERLLNSQELPEDSSLEGGLRPKNLNGYIGQKAVVDNVKIFIEAAKKNGRPLDHLLLAGPPGLGKTTLSQIIANEMGVNMLTTSGPVIEKKGDLAGLLTALQDHDVLFIDEIHRLNPAVEESLYPAMEDFRFDIMLGEGQHAKSMPLPIAPFTLIGATTKTGLLSSPLRDRFQIVFRMDYYTVEELETIVKRSSKVLGITIDDDGAHEIARRSRGTPRIANRILKRVRDFALVKGNGNIDDENPQGLEFYLLDDNTYAVSAGTSIYLSNIVIPETYKGKPVTKIVDEAFKDNDNIKSLVIGNNVKEIGQYAFENCDHLVSVTLGESIETIAGAAFSNCIRLVEVINKSNYIHKNSYGQYTITAGHPYGGYVAMNALKVKTSGTTAIVNENDYVFYNDGYRDYLVDYVGTDAEITLPASYNGGEYKLFKNAFAYNNKITSVTINGGVVEVDGFKNCENLETVRILADSVREIESSCFANCSNLETVVIGSNVNRIRDFAFSGCSAISDVNFLNKTGHWRAGSIDIDISTGASAASALKTYYSEEIYKLI